MSSVKNFCDKWKNHTIEDWCGEMSPDAMQFAKSFRTAFTKDLKSSGAVLENFSVGHYDFSGFAVKGDKCVYFSYSIPRGNTSLLGQSWQPLYSRGFCYRTAESAEDYCGDTNHFCDLEDCSERIINMLNA